MSVEAYRKDLDILLFALREKSLQLPELIYAVTSEVATVKDQDDVLVAAVARQLVKHAGLILESEIRNRRAFLHPIEIGHLRVDSWRRRGLWGWKRSLEGVYRDRLNVALAGAEEKNRRKSE